MSVSITEQHSEAMLALLSGDMETYELSLARIQADDGLTGYAMLVAATLVEAVNRKFPDGLDYKGVIELVGSIRSTTLNESFSINPIVAERMMLWALGSDDSFADVDDDEKSVSQLALLLYLCKEMALGEAELVDLCSAAVKILEQSSEE